MALRLMLCVSLKTQSQIERPIGKNHFRSPQAGSAIRAFRTKTVPYVVRVTRTEIAPDQVTVRDVLAYLQYLRDVRGSEKPREQSRQKTQ